VITGDHERAKVGVSIDPNRRRAELQTDSPFPLRLAYVAVTPGTGYDMRARLSERLIGSAAPMGWATGLDVKQKIVAQATRRFPGLKIHGKEKAATVARSDLPSQSC